MLCSINLSVKIYFINNKFLIDKTNFIQYDMSFEKSNNKGGGVLNVNLILNLT